MRNAAERRGDASHSHWMPVLVGYGVIASAWILFANASAARDPDPDQVDMTYYFDGDDCSQGALMGRDDVPGYLFPVGHKSWREMAKLEPPSKDAESIVAIAPLTKDKEGLAFWVKTGAGEFVLARIKAVQPVTYSDLVSGATASLRLE